MHYHLLLLKNRCLAESASILLILWLHTIQKCEFTGLAVLLLTEPFLEGNTEHRFNCDQSVKLVGTQFLHFADAEAFEDIF